VRYEPGSKGYRLWNSSTRSIVLSRDVTFDERSFPYKEITQYTAAPSKPTVSEGCITIYYNTPTDTGGYVPQLPVLPATPAQRPSPERAETEFHTPLSQPTALTPPQCPHLQRVRRDPEVPPRSALPGPAFGPACPPSSHCLRENSRPNLRYHNPVTVVLAWRQPRNCVDGDLQHTALLNALVYVATTEYQDPLTFRQAMNSALAEEWREACQY
jgi:hypothetical protein